MNSWKKIYLALYLLVLTAFTGCGTKIAVTSLGDGNSSIELNLELGKIFEKVLDESTAALNEMNGNQKPNFFYAEEIKGSLVKAGLKNVVVSSPDRTKLNVSFTGNFEFIECKKNSVVLKLNPEAMKKFAGSLGAEFMSIMDLFMAPVITGEEMSQKDYKETLSAIYGTELADDLAGSAIQMTLCSASGKKKNFSIPLIQLLTLEEEKIFSVAP